ncbi:MAG: hypothetical protein ABIN25_05845 [Ginsengibacter sp.]
MRIANSPVLRLKVAKGSWGTLLSDVFPDRLELFKIFTNYYYCGGLLTMSQ